MGKTYSEVASFHKKNNNTDSIMKERILDRALLSFDEKSEHKANYDNGSPFIFAENNDGHYTLLVDTDSDGYRHMYIGTFAEFCEYIQGYADALHYVREQHG